MKMNSWLGSIGTVVLPARPGAEESGKVRFRKGKGGAGCTLCASRCGAGTPGAQQAAEHGGECHDARTFSPRDPLGLGRSEKEEGTTKPARRRRQQESGANKETEAALLRRGGPRKAAPPRSWERRPKEVASSAHSTVQLGPAPKPPQFVAGHGSRAQMASDGPHTESKDPDHDLRTTARLTCRATAGSPEGSRGTQTRRVTPVAGRANRCRAGSPSGRTAKHCG